MAVGRDEGRMLSEEAAGGQVHEEGFLGALAVGADEAVVDQLSAPLLGDPVGDQDETALGPLRGFDPQAEGVEEQVLVGISQGAGGARRRRRY